MSKKMPRSRADLHVQELQAECLVLDPVNGQVHCLNAAAASVFARCDGARSFEEVAQELSEVLGESPIAAVAQAVDEFRKKELLAAEHGLKRRELMTMAARGAAILPLVSSVLLPVPAAADSCFEIGAGVLCAPRPCGDVCRTAGTSCNRHCAQLRRREAAAADCTGDTQLGATIICRANVNNAFAPDCDVARTNVANGANYTCCNCP